ncbi:MAG: glycosyltransferase family 1 protein [Nitrospirota bacterium]
MRVLLNTKPFVLSHKTGVGYYVFNLYRELLKSGIDVVPTLDTTSRTLVSSLSKVSSRLRNLMGKWYPSFVRYIGDALISGLSEKDGNTSSFDIYHETSLDPLPEIKTKSVCNLYDLSFMNCTEFLPEDFVKNARTNVTKNVLTAKSIIVNSQFVKDETIDLMKIPEEKIEIIPLAPSSVYHRLDEPVSRPENVKRFTKKDYILYVGTIEPRKNLRTLMKAFRLIKEKYDISLIITGNLGWLYDDIISFPEKVGIKGDVVFTGYIDEGTLLYLYNHALVFVYPSLYEGFGLPPLEAMACEVPVIISNIPPLTEVAGDAALRFNPSDHEELADVLDNVISSESLRRELVQKGIRKVKEYSWEKAALSTIQTYKKALET